MPDFPKAYWSEWSDSIITRYSLREGPKGEWHGACPNCGHNDWPSTRFWIHQKDGLVKFQCRQCNDFQAIVQIMEEDNVWPLLEKKAPTIKLKQTAQDYFGKSCLCLNKRSLQCSSTRTRRIMSEKELTS